MARGLAADPRDATLDAVRGALRGRRLDVRGLAFQAALLLALVVALGVLVILLVDVISRALPVFQERGGDFLTSNLSSLPSRAGVSQGIWGSLLLMVFVALVSFPIGVAAAIYIEEYARNTRFTRFVTANIRNLAGVPSIVYGLLGLAIFVQLLGPVTGGRTLMSGGLTLAILVLPIVVITSAEAIRAVPVSIREAAFGVGATRWEVIRSHVLPYAAPGILTGTVLSFARALGETAPLLLIGGAPGFFATGEQGVLEAVRGPYTALPAIVFNWSRESFREFGNLAAAAIVVLLAVLLLVNATAIVLRNRYERRW
jgi:phosphate transport system permease protein